MVAGYLESKEGQKAFAEIGQPYPKSLQDELYDDWLKSTVQKNLGNIQNIRKKKLLRYVELRQGTAKSIWFTHMCSID